MLVQWLVHEEDGTLLAKEKEAIYALCDLGNKLLAGSAGGMLNVIDKTSKSVLKRIACAAKPVFDIAVAGDSILLACGDGRLLVFDRDFSLKEEHKLSAHSLRKVLVIDKGRIAVAGSESHIWIMDDRYRVTEILQDHQLSVFALAFRYGDQRLISGGRDARLRVHHGAILEQAIAAHLLHIHALAFNPPQTYLLSSSMDKTIKLWDGQSLELLKVIDQKYHGHTSSVNKVIWLDNNTFVSCSDDRRIMAWRIDSD